MHEIVSASLASGFAVPVPGDIFAAVQAALVWGLTHRDFLRVLTPADFELLPALQPAQPLAWWLLIPLSNWIVDGMLHPLSHALGFSGSFWDQVTRSEFSRLHLSLSLTQEFITVSPAMPVHLYGDPAVRFYVSTMPPPHLLVFPNHVTRLHSNLTVRWGYHHGNAAQIYASMIALLPIMLRDCINLPRFLSPATGISSQVVAYRTIADVLSCPFPPEIHKVS